MAYDIFVRRRIDELEEKLLMYQDPVERLHLWFTFVKAFTMETHTLYDMQYTELVALCKTYADTPDFVVRKALKQQIVSCSREIENLNSQLKRIPRIQLSLEKAVTGSGDNHE